jgi:hypothetical protein
LDIHRRTTAQRRQQRLHRTQTHTGGVGLERGIVVRLERDSVAAWVLGNKTGAVAAVWVECVYKNQFAVHVLEFTVYVWLQGVLGMTRYFSAP